MLDGYTGGRGVTNHTLPILNEYRQMFDHLQDALADKLSAADRDFLLERMWHLDEPDRYLKDPDYIRHKSQSLLVKIQYCENRLINAGINVPPWNRDPRKPHAQPGVSPVKSAAAKPDLKPRTPLPAVASRAPRHRNNNLAEVAAAALSTGGKPLIKVEKKDERPPSLTRMWAHAAMGVFKDKNPNYTLKDLEDFEGQFMEWQMTLYFAFQAAARSAGGLKLMSDQALKILYEHHDQSEEYDSLIDAFSQVRDQFEFNAQGMVEYNAPEPAGV